jgi:Tfp pilus assembly protein PilF
MVGQRSARLRVPFAAPCLALRPALCLAFCLSLTAACRSLAPGAAAEPDLARGLRARHLDPAAVIVPWQLDAEMRIWAHRNVSDQLPTEQRLDRLLAVLLGQEGLDLTYQTGATGTARDVFASHRANCLAFTSLFVGMARELGIDAFYLEVGDIEKFEREGTLVVASDHVTAGFGSGSLLRILEFTPLGKPNYRRLHRISDLTAIALFYSNRGAELLRTNQERESLVWLRQAVAVDPELARGWINLGVALRRSGDPAGAEAAYRKALEADPSAVAAYQNLAMLLFVTGRGPEGDQLMALSGKLDIRNPFNFLSLGDVALSHGRFEEARHFYRKAQHLEGAGAEAEAALGQLALAQGDRRQARRWLRKAAARDGTNERVRRLAAQLGEGAAGART